MNAALWTTLWNTGDEAPNPCTAWASVRITPMPLWKPVDDGAQLRCGPDLGKESTIHNPQALQLQPLIHMKLHRGGACAVPLSA